nr:hypothetical protein [Tanacetum cinerariifolium]
MLNPSPDTGIDSIFESTPRVDVPVMTTVELSLLYATTLPPPSIPIISHVQQTPSPSPGNVPSLSLQDLSNFGSLFGFDHRLKTLETKLLEFMQTNQFDVAISLIPEDNKGASQKESQVQVSKILPKIEKTVNEQLKTEVLTRSSILSKTSHDVAANLSKLELKKILIDKIESNKSIHISYKQQNLYKALVDAYECDKLILDTYGDAVTLKRRQDNEDKNEEPSTRSNRGSKRRRVGKELKSTKEPMHTTQDLEEPVPQEFETGATGDQPVEEASQHPRWESARDVYSKCRIIVVTGLQIVEWNNYKHLDWIIVRRDNEKLYKFKEGNFKRLRIQDIEYMLLLLVQGKLTNLTIDECVAFNVSLRMFTISTVIQRRVEDLQLGNSDAIYAPDHLEVK